jgi:hypothetical protein
MVTTVSNTLNQHMSAPRSRTDTTVTSHEESEGTNLVQGFMEVIPVLTVIAGMGAAWFNLQGQLIELRARYEAYTVTSREAIVDLREDIKDTNKLLREMVQQQQQSRPNSNK